MKGLTITSAKLPDGRGYETKIRAADPVMVDRFIQQTSGDVTHMAADGKSAVIVSQVGWQTMEAAK